MHHISSSWLNKRLQATAHIHHPAPLCYLQVMYSQDKHGHPSVVETNTTSLELSLPINQDYVIQIKPFSEGGEGSSSRQITIPKIAGRTELRYETWKWCLCPFVNPLVFGNNGSTTSLYFCNSRFVVFMVLSIDKLSLTLLYFPPINVELKWTSTLSFIEVIVFSRLDSDIQSLIHRLENTVYIIKQLNWFRHANMTSSLLFDTLSAALLTSSASSLLHN